MENISHSHVIDRHLINGPHNPMFWRYADVIGKFVKEMKLEPIEEQMTLRSLEVNKLSPEPPWWKYGGMRLSHVHLAGHTYLLKDEQWKKFSNILIDNFEQKLKGASGVSFENALNIANSMENLI